MAGDTVFDIYMPGRIQSRACAGKVLRIILSVGPACSKSIVSLNPDYTSIVAQLLVFLAVHVAQTHSPFQTYIG